MFAWGGVLGCKNENNTNTEKARRLISGTTRAAERRKRFPAFFYARTRRSSPSCLPSGLAERRGYAGPVNGDDSVFILKMMRYVYCFLLGRFLSAAMIIGEKLAITDVIAAPVNPSFASITQATMPPAPRNRVKICPIIGITSIDSETLSFVFASDTACVSAIFIIRSGKEASISPNFFRISGLGIGPE